MEYKCTRERFLNDIKDHQMEIVKDDGVYRHVIFKRPESSAYRFDLITWPYNLCICGDMGTWVFQRIEDMFEFFIMDDNDFNKKNVINPGYWEEKITSLSKFGDNGKAKVFDLELFQDSCNESIRTYFEDNEEEQERCIEDFKDEVIYYADDCSSDEIYKKAWGYKYEDSEEETHRIFNECESIPSGTKYSLYYIWILYAIVWGIDKYNSSKIAEAENKAEE